MDISSIFSVKVSLMIRYICIICIFDSKLSCGEISSFINTLITFSGMIIFLRFDITYSNILFVNIMSDLVLGYDRFFHIVSLSLINLHWINSMCRSVIFSGLILAVRIFVFVVMSLLDEFGFNIL